MQHPNIRLHLHAGVAACGDFCPGKLLRIHLILQHCPGASDGILLPGHTFHTDIAASACVHWLLRDTPNAGSPRQDKEVPS